MPEQVKYQEVPLSLIRIAKDRGRKVFDRVQELADSIKVNGLMNPIYVTNDPEKPGGFLLVAGERRYRASILAGRKTVPITFHDHCSDLQQKILELEENVCRQDLTWQEQAELHRQIHELKTTENPNQTQTQTAKSIGISDAHLSRQISLAKALKEDPTLKEKVGKLDMRSAEKVVAQQAKIAVVDRLKAEGKLKITSELLLGSCLDRIKELKDGSVDLVVTDPPYGLEALEDLRESDGSVMYGHVLMSDTHNMKIDDVLKVLSQLGPELARVCKPGAHVYVFAAYQYVGDFIKALAPLQFQPPVLHWDRGRPTTPGYGYNYLNHTEAVIYLHNPPRGKRLAKNVSNILQFPTVSKSERVYPTEKPQELLKLFISQSSILNDLVLDPFAGSASTLKAARTMGRRSIGFEINEDSWKQAQLHLANIEPEKGLFDKLEA